MGKEKEETTLCRRSLQLLCPLSAQKIIVEGKHQGNLKCDDLKIASSAQVQAEVSAKTIATESGARVVGKLRRTFARFVWTTHIR